MISRQTPKERMLRALRGLPPDVLPAAPAYLSLFLAGLEHAHYLEQVRRRLGSRRSYRIDHDEDTGFRAEALIRSYGLFRARPDWIEVYAGPPRAWSERASVVASGDALFFEDRRTGERVPMEAPHSAAGAWAARTPVRDKADVDALLPVVPARDILSSGEMDLPRRILAECGDEYLVTTILETPCAAGYDLLGFQGSMLIQHDDPALLHHILRRSLAQQVELMDAWAATGVHAVYFEEAFTGADLISPRAYDRFVYAYNRPYFRHLRSLGLLAVHYVSGDAVARLERICEYEIDAVAVEESKKAFTLEIEEVVRRVAGRLSVLGNVDSVRYGRQAPLADMEAEVRRQARIGQQARGFVVSTGSPLPPDTDPRLVDTLVATAHSIPGSRTSPSPPGRGPG